MCVCVCVCLCACVCVCVCVCVCLDESHMVHVFMIIDQNHLCFVSLSFISSCCRKILLLGKFAFVLLPPKLSCLSRFMASAAWAHDYIPSF